MDFSDCGCIEDIRLKQELLQMTSVNYNSDLLYHYTSSQGLCGILRHKELKLRFTRSDCLNDITEGNSINQFYSSICDRLLLGKRISQEYFDSIINISPLSEYVFIYEPDPPLIFNNESHKTGFISQFITYVFCFSTLSDSLPLWNYFLKNGLYEGYNLGFSPQKLKEAFHYYPFKRNYSSEFIVVEYDENEKDDILMDFVEALYRFRETDDAQLSKTKGAISQELFKWQYAFKPDYFSHEKEVRLIIRVPLNENKTALAPFVKPQLLFDDESGIPKYIFASINKAALTEITISPLYKDEGQKILLSELIGKKYDVNINYSKIPIRF